MLESGVQRKDPGGEQFLAVKNTLKDRSKALHSRECFLKKPRAQTEASCHYRVVHKAR